MVYCLSHIAHAHCLLLVAQCLCLLPSAYCLWKCFCACYCKVSLYKNGKIPTTREKHHPLNGFSFIKQIIPPKNDLSQADAKIMLPPSSYIWRANCKGAWLVRCLPHKSHAEPWHKHDDCSYTALLAAVRFAWGQWLSDRGLPNDHCPIAGVF